MAWEDDCGESLMGLADSAKGFGVTFLQHVRAGDAAVPGGQAPGLPAASAAAIGCTATRMVSRTASGARCARRPARPTASVSSPTTTPMRGALRRRALRPDLRDQHDALHLLRLLRTGMPGRRDYARPRLRVGGHEPRRDLVYTKDMLLEPMHPSRTTPVALVDPFDVVEPKPREPGQTPHRSP